MRRTTRRVAKAAAVVLIVGCSAGPALADPVIGPGELVAVDVPVEDTGSELVLRPRFDAGPVHDEAQLPVGCWSPTTRAACDAGLVALGAVTAVTPLEAAGDVDYEDRGHAITVDVNVEVLAGYANTRKSVGCYSPATRAACDVVMSVAPSVMAEEELDGEETEQR